mgnify:CR=1 FL=1
MTLLRTIEFDDGVIEIHHNILLKNKPYLLRLFSYNNYPQEIRLDEQDVKNILKESDEN